MTRLRDIGIVVGELPTGRWNAITDVEGVRVGHTTIVREHGDLVVGHGPVRTGVTVLQPRAGTARERPVFAASASLNGNGEMTGLEWVRESGLLTTPIGITNTHSVGTVRDALAAWDLGESGDGRFWSLPVVAETWDGVLNDVRGQHVRAEHVFEALDTARSGPVAEGNVGGGTGMVCHGFKGGSGTSSRLVSVGDRTCTVGVLVQANHGRRDDLRVNGVPVAHYAPLRDVPLPATGSSGPIPDRLPPGAGSIIVIVATDAPLLPDQCRRLAMRAGLGIARTGGGMADSSGDIALAFATGNDTVPGERYRDDLPATFPLTAVPHQHVDPLLRAVVEATEEAILNALLAAETMTGCDHVTVHALDPEALRLVMSEHRNGAGSGARTRP